MLPDPSLAYADGAVSDLTSRVAIVTGGTGALGQAVSLRLLADGAGVAIPYMDTPANRAAMPDADRSGWVPVEAVADAIATLVRPESARITGTLVMV